MSEAKKNIVEDPPNDAPPVTNIIQCVDGPVAISTLDMERVFKAMPTLQHLFLGRHDMQGSYVTMVADGTRMITIHKDWGTRKKPFMWMLQCALGSSALPADDQDRNDVINLLRTFGGWSVLDRIHAIKAEAEAKEEKRRLDALESLTPMNDPHDIFEWRTLGPLQKCNFYSERPAEDRALIESCGFTLRHLFEGTTEGRDRSHDNYCIMYFRRLRLRNDI